MDKNGEMKGGLKYQRCTNYNTSFLALDPITPTHEMVSKWYQRTAAPDILHQSVQKVYTATSCNELLTLLIMLRIVY